MTPHISTNGVAVDQDYFWQPMETCPRGVKVQLLGEGGVAVYGTYDGKTAWQGWAPLPKKPVAQATQAVAAIKTVAPRRPEVLESVGYQYPFYSPFGGEVWRDTPDMWNGNRPAGSREIFADPRSKPTINVVASSAVPDGKAFFVQDGKVTGVVTNIDPAFPAAHFEHDLFPPHIVGLVKN